MRRADAESVFGAKLVADALSDPAPVRVDAATFGVFARIFADHASEDLDSVRLVVVGYLSTLKPSEARAVVRRAVGGVSEALDDIARDERRERMH